MAQWAKRPPLKLEVPGSNPRGWFNGRAGNRDPFRWLETARGLYTHPIDWKGSVFPRRTGRFFVKKGDHIASFRCLSDEITSFFLGLGRERLTPGTSGSRSRKPRVVASSHDAKARRRKVASDPERISNDGG